MGAESARLLGEAAAVSRVHVQFGWDDAPHLDEAAKADLRKAYPPYQLDARTKGIPQLGSGAIYPIAESDILVDPVEIQPWWRRAYGLDVGWNRTAAVWGAYDSDADILYWCGEYERSMAEPSVHAGGIRLRGEWQPGVIDPASRGRSQKDGAQLFQDYTDLGLKLTPANNAVEHGLFQVYQRMTTGRLKIFRNLVGVIREFRLYRRDEKGRIVKENDHLMDACFVGSTPVWTNRGQVAIKELVGTVGKVVSRSGVMVAFSNARMTRENAETVLLVFDDGSTIQCTPEHRFLTSTGWVKAIDLKGLDCYNGVSQRIHWKQIWSRSLSRLKFNNSAPSATTCWASIFEPHRATVLSFCTEMSGHTIMTGEAFQPACRSTISIMIDTITRPRTWFLCLKETTCLTTTLDVNDRLQTKLCARPPIGMAVRKVLNGIANTTNKPQKSFMSRLIMSANTAGKHIERVPISTIVSAPTLARRAGGSTLGSTMRNGLAWFAATCLWRISTLKQKPVGSSVLLRCLSVREAERADVYCLTVPATQAFCVGAGVIAHNCRYLTVSGIDVAIIAPNAGQKYAEKFGRGHSVAAADFNPYA